MECAPTPVGLFYILLTSALLTGELNPLVLDADCAYGLLKLLLALMRQHSSLTPPDTLLGRKIVGFESVRMHSQVSLTAPKPQHATCLAEQGWSHARRP